ncbi:MAG: DMT family transporter [Kiloniellales bacterium]
MTARPSSSATAAARPAADDSPHESPLPGIALLVTAMAVVPVMDGIAKYLSASYPVSQIVWARYFFHMAILLPLVLWQYGKRGLLPRRPLAQLLRSSFLLCSTVFFFAAIALIPLADAIALVFISPLIVTACSPFVLGEQVGIRRWSAVLIGFLGALIVFRPGLGVFQLGSLLAVAAGSTYACYILATRKLSGSAPPLVTLLQTAVVGAVVMSLIVPFTWVAPAASDLALMAAMGAVAAGGHFLIIKAFERAPASLLAPYGYSEIVTATLIGYLVFGDFPDHWTWLGIAVIVAAGIYISLRERRRRRPVVAGMASAAPSPDAPPTPDAPGAIAPERRDRGAE